MTARTPLKYMSRVVNGGTPPSTDVAMWNGQYPFITPPDLANADGALVHTTGRSITELGLKHSGIAPQGSVILSTRAPIGHVGRSVAPSSAFNQGCRALVPYKATDARFLAYALIAARPQLESLGVGTTFLELSANELSRFRLPSPSLAQQQSVANYLDRETTQIDAFIAKNEELISFLAERADAEWSALANRAHQHGNEVPVRRVLASIVDGPFGSSLTSAHYSDRGTRVIRLGNIGVFEFRDSDAAFISDEYAGTLTSHEARAGDVIIAGLGDDRMPLGRACVLPKVGPAIVKADCYRARPNAMVTSEFLAWAISSPPARAQIALLARGSTRQRLNTAVVRDIRIPVPPIEIQRELVAAYSFMRDRTASAIASARKGIALAKERRVALISAAVAGKIDVRSAA